jgi:ABC-2 type transport system permease protein
MRGLAAKVARSFSVLKAVALVTYKEWAAYRSHMLLSLFIGPAYFLSQNFIWKAVFSARADVGGFSLEGMLGYYATVTLIYYLTMDFADWNLQMHIRTGSFLTFMLRPLSHRYFAFSQKVGHRILGFFFELIPVWLLLAVVFRITLLPASWPWAVASIALGFVMTFFLNYSIGIAAFWMTRTDGLRSIFALFRDIMAGSFLPLTLFPLPFQKVFFFLPFQYATYVPTKVFLGSYELGGIKMSLPEIVGCQALAVLGMWLVSELLWRLGARRYTGVGA